MVATVVLIKTLEVHAGLAYLLYRERRHLTYRISRQRSSENEQNASNNTDV